MAKVFRSGDELAIHIPAEIAAQLGFVEGTTVDIRMLDDQHLIVTRDNTLPRGIDPEFVRHLEEFVEDYREALENLANRRGSSPQETSSVPLQLT